MQADSDNEQRAEPAGSCNECGAAYAQDQRYCLECGAPLPAAEATVPLPVITAEAALVATGTASYPGLQPAGASPSLGSPPLPSSGARSGSGGSAPTVIAGVGVLLLAMGVGVLIGRAGNNAAPASNTPQVITVPASTTTAPSEESEEAESPSGTSTGSSGNEAKKSHNGSAKHGASGSSGSKAKGEGGSSKSTSPSSALKKLEEPGGKETYEQKSNNLPNVVGT